MDGLAEVFVTSLTYTLYLNSQNICFISNLVWSFLQSSWVSYKSYSKQGVSGSWEGEDMQCLFDFCFCKTRSTFDGFRADITRV